MYIDGPAQEVTAQSMPARRSFSISSQVLPGLIVVLDAAVIMIVALVSFYSLVGVYVDDVGYYAAAIASVWIIAIFLMHFGGLYQLDAIMRPLAFADKTAIAFLTTFLFLVAAAFSLKVSASFSRVWVGTFAVGALTATLLARLLAAQIVAQLARRRVFTRDIVIAGASEQVRRLLSHIQTAKPPFITLRGVFLDGPDQAAILGTDVARLGGLGDLVSHVRSNSVDDVVIALPWSEDERILSVVTQLRELPVNVYLGSDLIGFRLPFRQSPDHFGELPLVEVMGRPLAGWGMLQKTILDYSLALTLLILLLPVMGLIALAIKLDSRGPVFFRQERYGFVNRVFRIYKFRTMRRTIEPVVKNVQATRNDPRVTKLGRFLRRTSLDELPQLFNVVNGTMSIVGPRPHASDHNEEYSQVIRGYFARHRVKPGITGWAQVKGFRGETKTPAEMEARVKYDIYYVENWTLLFDLKVILMTIVVILNGRNAY